MRKDGEWGDHSEVLLAADLYHTPVHIYNIHSRQFVVENPSDSDKVCGVRSTDARSALASKVSYLLPAILRLDFYPAKIHLTVPSYPILPSHFTILSYLILPSHFTILSFPILPSHFTILSYLILPSHPIPFYHPILQKPIFLAFDYENQHYDALEPIDGDISDVPMDTQ